MDHLKKGVMSINIYVLGFPNLVVSVMLCAVTLFFPWCTPVGRCCWHWRSPSVLPHSLHHYKMDANIETYLVGIDRTKRRWNIRNEQHMTNVVLSLAKVLIDEFLNTMWIGRIIYCPVAYYIVTCHRRRMCRVLWRVFLLATSFTKQNDGFTAEQ